MPLWPTSGPSAEKSPFNDRRAAQLLLFQVFRRRPPGVLSKISGILGENNISIYSVIQKGRQVEGSVPVVMLTHEAKESSVRRALYQMEQLEVLTDKTVTIRVEPSSKQ